MGFDYKEYNVHVPTMTGYTSNKTDFKYTDVALENLDVDNRSNEVESINLEDNNNKQSNYYDLMNEQRELKNRESSTVIVGALSLVEGLGQFGEALVDTAAIVTAAAGTPLSWIVDQTVGLLGYESNSTEKIWNDTKSFVTEEHIKGAFDSFYDSSIGQSLSDNAYGFDIVRGVGSGVGNVIGIVGLTVFTLGTGTVAMGAAGGASLTMSQGMGIVGATAGFGRGAEKAWNDGASTGKGLAYAAGNAAWEGTQYYLGGRISEFGGLGEQLAKSVFSASNRKIGASISRIALTALDAGAEGFTQPYLDTLYKDDSYIDLFKKYGGWKNVGIQTAIGAGLSLFAEGSHIRDYINRKKIYHNTFSDDIIENVGDPTVTFSEVDDTGIDFSTQIEDLSDKIETNLPNYDAIDIPTLDAVDVPTLDTIMASQTPVDGIIMVPSSYLDELGIKLPRNQQIVFDPVSGEYYRVGNNFKPGSRFNPNSKISSNYLRDPSSFASERLILTTDKKGTLVYIDPLSVNGRYTTFTNIAEGSKGYEHVFYGEVTDSMLKGGHCLKTLLDNNPNVRVNISEDPVTHVLVGSWEDVTLDLPAKTDCTFFPESWNEEKIVESIKEVGKTRPIAINTKNNRSLYLSNYDGLDIVIMKDVRGDIVSAYPKNPYREVAIPPGYIDLR